MKFNCNIYILISIFTVIFLIFGSLPVLLANNDSMFMNIGSKENDSIDLLVDAGQAIPDQKSLSTRGDRETTYESEPNNIFSEANDISNLVRPVEIIDSSLSIWYSNPDDSVDIYKIGLTGRDKPVDNLTVKLKNLNSNDYYIDRYCEFFISIYGKYESKFLLMEVVQCHVGDWYDEEDCPVATIHAFDTGDYYIKVSIIGTYSYIDGSLLYSLEVSTDKYYPDDDNQVFENADEIFGPITKKTVRMDTDIFDWYYIDVESPENYSTNFSFSIDITQSKATNAENINGQALTFVTELYVLIYSRDKRGIVTFEGEVIGNKFNKYDHDDPLNYYRHFDKNQPQSFLLKNRFYLGIYVQTLGKTNDGEGEYIWGHGHCDGWIEYEIKKLQPKPMIPPVLKKGKVDAPVGKVYNTFTYFVEYFDENNDRPREVTLTIDNKPSQYKMQKLDDNDKNYQDGCVFKYSLDGAVFESGREVHEFSIFAEDVEEKAEKFKGIGPIITDNILPVARPSSSDQYTIYEDDAVSYLDLNNTFEDPDNDTLYYRVSSNSIEWSRIYNSENVTVNVVTLIDDNGISNKFLEIKPKKNRYNRLSGHKFGSEIIYINVSDDDPDHPGFPDENDRISRAHYIWPPFELELVIIEVNDPPQIKTPFRYSQDFINGEMIFDEDQSYLGFELNTVFWDPVENNPLSYSVLNSNNVQLKFYKNTTGDFMDIIPKANWSGIESLEIVASDGNAWISDTLRIRVLPVNDNPYLNYTPKQIIYENKWFNTTFIGYDEVDNDIVYFETNLFFILDLPEENYIFITETGELKFKPGHKNVGTHKDIWVAVKDYNGGKTLQYIIFEILNTPDKPVPQIMSPNDGERFLNTDQIDFHGEYTDFDDELLLEPHTFKWTSNQDGILSTEQSFHGSLSAGEHVITLMVSDSMLAGNISINILIVSESAADRDGDKLPDYWEVLHFLNENNPHDANEDWDSDTYSNLEEYLGMDGKAGGYDDTDPNEPDDHPNKHFTKSKSVDYSYLYNWLGVIIISVFILAVIFLIVRQSRRQRKELDKQKEIDKPKEKEYFHDMFGRKYEIYSYEPVQIICHNCLEKQEIQIPIRPLVITCKKCKTRGVLYK